MEKECGSIENVKQNILNAINNSLDFRHLFYDCDFKESMILTNHLIKTVCDKGIKFFNEKLIDNIRMFINDDKIDIKSRFYFEIFIIKYYDNNVPMHEIMRETSLLKQAKLCSPFFSFINWKENKDCLIEMNDDTIEILDKLPVREKNRLVKDEESKPVRKVDNGYIETAKVEIVNGSLEANVNELFHGLGKEDSIELVKCMIETLSKREYITKSVSSNFLSFMKDKKISIDARKFAVQQVMNYNFKFSTLFTEDLLGFGIIDNHYELVNG